MPCNLDLAGYTIHRTTSAPGQHFSPLRRIGHFYRAGLLPQCLVEFQSRDRLYIDTGIVQQPIMTGCSFAAPICTYSCTTSPTGHIVGGYSWSVIPWSSCPTSSVLLALGVMRNNAVQFSVAGRMARHHKVSCSASLPVGNASMRQPISSSSSPSTISTSTVSAGGFTAARGCFTSPNRSDYR